MNDNDYSSNTESVNSKENESYIISGEEEEEEEGGEKKNDKINENSIKNKSIDKNKKLNNNKIDNKNKNNFYYDDSQNKRIVVKNKNKILLDKQAQKSNKKLSTLLSSQKEENKILKEYNEILKSDEEDKNKELLNRIKELEEKLSSSNKIINNLNNNKDIVIQKLTKTNNKLKNSLENISQKLDEKLLNINLFKKRNNNISQKFGASFSTNNRSMISGKYNGPISHLSDDLTTQKNNRLKEKELNNAVNMIKILTNDNKRLQNKVNELEKNKVLEKENKDIEKMKIEKELREHKTCKEKIEKYKEKIRKLSDKNHMLLEKIFLIKSKKQNSSIFQIKNIYNKKDRNEKDKDNSEDNSINKYKTKIKLYKKINNSISLDKAINKSKKDDIINIKKIGIELVRTQNSSLPKINSNTNKSVYKLNYQNNSNINNIFNIEEKQQLNKIFKNNEEFFNIIVKKIEIIQKSKESLNNKFKIEKKQYIERIYSMQQQIDYLNGKIRENELKINILQSQLNENNIYKRQLLKKVKILSAGLELSESSGNNIIVENNINNKNEIKNNNEELTENNEINNINNNIINSNKKKLNGVRRASFIKGLNESNSLADNIVDNLEPIKDQKNNHNNSEFINEGDTILEENVSETSSKNKNTKIINEDESEKNYKSFL
jgi:hypothetical protein